MGAGPKRFDSIRQQQQQQSGSEDKKYQSSDDTGGDHIAVPFDFTKIRFSDHKSNRRESSTDCAFREQHRIFNLTDIIKLIARVVKVYKICISIRLTRVKEQAFIQGISNYLQRCFMCCECKKKSGHIISSVFK